MNKIKIAIAGVGNCASSLIQGIEYYKKNDHQKDLLGLMNYNIGGYSPVDVEVVAAFDVDKRKVGKPLKEAIFADPNCTMTICDTIEDGNLIVQMGKVLDGVAEHMTDYADERTFIVAEDDPCDVKQILKDSGAEILLNYLPVGSEQATKFYAQCCLDTGVSFINCIPVFIVSDKEWADKFKEKNIPVIGDDIKAQIGATIVHRTLTRLFVNRGVTLDKTYQLNTGGNTDFLNMLNRRRLKSKKISKTEAVQSQMDTPLKAENIHIGPSDYVPWQNDNKVCFIRMEGRGFAGVPMHLEMRLSVEDSPNSAGIAIDAIRCCKLARDNKTGGPLYPVSAYTMKHPPVQMTDEDARRQINDFIAGKEYYPAETI